MIEADKRNSERIIRPGQSILDALKYMDVKGIKSLIVIDSENKFLGILSIGDIQRAIIKNTDLTEHVNSILRPNPRFVNVGCPIENIKNEMIKFRMEFLPMLNDDKNIEKIFYWEDLFLEEKTEIANPVNLPVVIMAGGIGSRLKPLTNVLPKPLIPFNEKTMLEEIFDRFARHGCNTFFVSINYKADLIEYFIDNLKLPYRIEFFREEKPLGTAGSLSLLKDKIKETFFVSNCDILIEQDYSEILDYHRSNKNEITVVAALKHFPLEYGVVEAGENGHLIGIREKPELTFKINSGMYILEPHLLKEIPENSFYHITLLIEKLRELGRNVGVFPVSEKSWQDTGDKDNLRKFFE